MSNILFVFFKFCLEPLFQVSITLCSLYITTEALSVPQFLNYFHCKKEHIPSTSSGWNLCLVPASSSSYWNQVHPYLQWLTCPQNINGHLLYSILAVYIPSMRFMHDSHFEIPCLQATNPTHTHTQIHIHTSPRHTFLCLPQGIKICHTLPTW